MKVFLKNFEYVKTQEEKKSLKNIKEVECVML